LSKRDRERIATLLARLAEEATFTREVVLAEATDAELAALVESSDT
jgi:hypothetical protein